MCIWTRKSASIQPRTSVGKSHLPELLGCAAPRASCGARPALSSNLDCCSDRSTTHSGEGGSSVRLPANPIIKRIKLLLLFFARITLLYRLSFPTMERRLGLLVSICLQTAASIPSRTRPPNLGLPFYTSSHRMNSYGT